MAQKRTRPGMVILQIVLGIVIVVLAWFLYRSIKDPFVQIEREMALTEKTRDRMNDLRIALRFYEEENDRFPHTLDSVLMYMQTDSLLTADADSIFGVDLLMDSVLYSARGARPFEYVVNDTSRMRVYYLKDPASDDYIGTREPDITQLHAASWE
jgi:hypothetical protein